MAKKKKDKGAGVKLLQERSLYDSLKEHKDASERAFTEVRDSLEEKEALLVGTLKDEYSTNTARSQVFDPRLSTISIERSSRVMSNVPAGKVMGVSQNDMGKNALMNLCVDKYAIPNANSQFDFLIKSRLWDLYSLVYGVMFQMVDWRVDERMGYIGPDSWIVPIRDAFPQAGAISIEECDYFQVSTMVSAPDLEQYGDDWKHLDDIISDLKEGKGKSRTSLPSERRSHVEEKRHYDIKANNVEIITEYRTYGGKDDKGEWISYSPDYPQKILRKIDNQHQNGEIPVVAKYAFPLMDSIYGLGEFERGKTLQYAINSLINLYLDGVKMSLFPPVMINPDGVVPSSIKFGPAEKWLVRVPDAVKQFNVNPAGIQTFNSTYSFLIAAILNQAGTTTTTTSAKTDPGLGKTPQALKLLESRENSRDSWDGFMMEKAQSQLLRKFVNLIARKQTKPIKLRLFEQEIKEIAQIYPDVLEMYDTTKQEVKVKSDTFSGIQFDYQVVPGSLQRVSEEEQFQNLTNMMALVTNPQAGQQIQSALRKRNKKVDLGELFTRMVAVSRLNDWDKIVTDLTEEDLAEQQAAQMVANPPQYQDQEVNEVAQQLHQSLLGGVGGIPQTPPQG